jgi:hypothetical protein
MRHHQRPDDGVAARPESFRLADFETRATTRVSWGELQVDRHEVQLPPATPGSEELRPPRRGPRSG